MTVNTALKNYALDPFNVNFYQTVNATATATNYPGPGVPVPQFELGTEAIGENGTHWMYVQAASAIKLFDCVSITEVFQAASLTNANAKLGYIIGFAQVAFATSDYGWVALRGSAIQCRVKAVLRRSSKIYSPATSSGSAGVLRASATGRIKIQGLMTITTSSGSAKSPEVQAVWPLLLN